MWPHGVNAGLAVQGFDRRLGENSDLPEVGQEPLQPAPDC